MSISPTGSNPTPFGFVGGSQYQTDADSGLMLLGERYYDSSIGRFISKDPAQAGTNWYAYCENNPLGATDPSGLLSVDDIIQRGIARGELPKEALPKYRTDPAFKRSIHEEMGKRKTPGAGRRNPDLPEEEVIEIVKDHLPHAIIAAGVGTVIVVGIWEGLKWTAAILGAPETAGASLAAAALSP
jgi:RHS repeat-associated protein